MTNYIEPQSASAPITTNLRKDELAALQTVEQGATAGQRIIATGNSVPLVFTKLEGGVGGAWVTPPAARYGAEENPNNGDYYAFGLVISDGQIPAIADADIWKGPVRANTLSEYAATNAYGSLATSGYDYSLRSVAADTPSSSNTVTTNHGPADSAMPMSFSIANCSSLRFSQATVGQTSSWLSDCIWYVYADGALHDTIPLTDKTGTYSTSFGGAVNMTFQAVWQGSGIDTSSWRIWFTALEYTTKVTTTTPSVPGAVTNLPLSPGSGGTFAGMSTLAVKGRYSKDADNGVYKQQIRCYVREGIIVDKVLGGSGSSNSFVDLAYYLLRSASKVSSRLIDLPSFQSAERFTAAMGLRFNGVIANSVNLRDYMGRVAPLFLLRFVQVNGKFGLQPVLPIDGGNRIHSGAITPKATFDDSNIVTGSFQKEYEPLAKRRPFCALMTWRSQSETSYGVPRTTEVRYAGTAIDGPFEQYDLEEFCTTEAQAIVVGKYIVASRKHATHSVAFSTTRIVGDLAPTDIIRVVWDYDAQVSPGGSRSLLYQVDSVTEGANGAFRIEATHFPVTASGASQVAVDMLSPI